MARCSMGLSDGGRAWQCRHPWPEDCSVQCGEKGIVLSKKGNYTTAFFEAFPKDPSCFIRGEGEGVEAAENDCWAKWEKIRDCENHEFERRGRKDGYGWCKHCGMGKGKAFEPLTRCHVCDTPTNWGTLKDNNWYCEEHYRAQPVEMAHVGFMCGIDEEDVVPGRTVGEAQDARDARLKHELENFDKEEFKRQMEELKRDLASRNADKGKS